MTVAEVKERVKAVALAADDEEKAHHLEDGLHHDVLRAIAKGLCEDPVACAAEALKTTDLDFARWYA